MPQLSAVGISGIQAGEDVNMRKAKSWISWARASISSFVGFIANIILS
ncbi:MAG: hypothetical protein PHO89_05770 [Methylacidiphilaceae bacterium]|nr:hypothetical protein [Candidatus Methylacidiphilaceae bacterium]